MRIEMCGSNFNGGKKLPSGIGEGIALPIAR